MMYDMTTSDRPSIIITARCQHVLPVSTSEFAGFAFSLPFGNSKTVPHHLPAASPRLFHEEKKIQRSDTRYGVIDM